MKVGDVIEVKVLKVDRDKGKIGLGLKQIKPDPWNGIADKYPVGSRPRGKVVRLAPFGAFIELEEGVDGLIHISEMSWIKRVGHPSELLKEGDYVEAAVLKVDLEKRELRLGLKQVTENPWVAAANKYTANSTHTGKVTRTSDFGAFVELEPGIEGLVHISELSDKRVNRVTDVTSAGKEVSVRVLSIDPEARRVSLSIKQAAMPAAAPPATPVPAAAPATPTPPPPPARKRDKPLRGGLGGGFNTKIG
jgi:small subunit ribosomal protein S1